MKFAVIDGGYEEYMRQLAEDCDREYAEFLAEYGPEPKKTGNSRFLEYCFALCDQRKESARRRCDVVVAGDCRVLSPGAFKR